jgi:hypothetical protein
MSLVLRSHLEVSALYTFVFAVLGGIFRGPSALEHRHTSVPILARVSALSHIGFSQPRGVLRPSFRTRHGLLEYQRSSACFDLPVCLQPVCLNLFLHQLHKLSERRPILEVSPMSRPTGKWEGSALADVVKSEAEYASLIANQRLPSPPHGRCNSPTTNSRGNLSRRECGSLVREGGA